MSKRPTSTPAEPEPVAETTSKAERGYVITLSGPAAEELKAMAAELGETQAIVKERLAAYFSDTEHPDRAAQLFAPVRRAIRLEKADALEAEAKKLRGDSGEGI